MPPSVQITLWSATFGCLRNHDSSTYKFIENICGKAATDLTPGSYLPVEVGLIRMYLTSLFEVAVRVTPVYFQVGMLSWFCATKAEYSADFSCCDSSMREKDWR